MSGPTEEDLRQFGWAPGDYMGDCRGCAACFTGAKRAWRCQDCAIEAFEQGPPAAAPAENPKRAAGMRKLPLELIPRVALVQEAAVLGLGADCPAKAYGRNNWRQDPVDAETYVGAIERHLILWAAGEDRDEQSGVSHLAHIRACCGIVMDAIDAGTFLDGRLVSPETVRILKGYDASSMPVVKPQPA